MELPRFIKALVLSCLVVIGCGGGGGGEDTVDSGIATVRIRNTPNLIDIGDTTFVTLDVYDIIDDGSIILKIQAPEGLNYLLGSSSIELGGSQVIRDPDMVFNSATDRSNYLVYFVSKFELQERNNLTLRFQLTGENPVANGAIGVDVDLDNPNIPNANEVEVENPKFSAEDETAIKVIR